MSAKDGGEMSNGPRAGCGAAILREGKFLLVRRRKAPEAGHWGLPGGKIDWMEPVERAVSREVMEELGIRLEGLKLLCVVDQIDEAEGEHWIAPVYTVIRFEGEPRIMEPEKHTDLGWFGLNDLPEPLTTATRQAVAALTPL